jgi:hypothetical protein
MNPPREPKPLAGIVYHPGLRERMMRRFGRA